MPALGEHRLRVELHALDRQLPVPQRHDHAGRRAAGDLELRRHGRRVDGERVVAGGGERRGQPGQHARAVVHDLAGLAVQQLRRPDDVRAEGLARSPGGPGRRRAPGSPPRRPRGPSARSPRPPAGVPGPGESSTPATSRSAQLVDGDGVVAAHDAARRRAVPGTGRGCRRSCRSCRRRGPGGRRRGSRRQVYTADRARCWRRRSSAQRGSVAYCRSSEPVVGRQRDLADRSDVKVSPKAVTACWRTATCSGGGQLRPHRVGVGDRGDDERRRVGAPLQQQGVAHAAHRAGGDQPLVHDRHAVGGGSPHGVDDRLDVGLVDDQVVGAGVDRQGAVGAGRGVVEGDDDARAR